MTIDNELLKLQTNLDASYDACEEKGATLPVNKNFDNLASCIDTIETATNPVISSLSITPTTSAQTITAPSGTDGYSPITVSAVTSSIDNDIIAGNIKSGVNILGVDGSVIELQGETRTVSLTNSSSSGQTFTPSSGKNGITSITVKANNQARTVTPSTSQQSLSVNSGYSGNGTITVNAVTSSIDNNIKATNIKSGVSILGVSGSVTELAGETRTVSLTNSSSSGQTFTPSSGKNGITSITVKANNQAKTVTPSTSLQSIVADAGYSGIGTVNVNAVTSSIDSNITAGNIKSGVSILGVTGSYGGGVTPSGTLNIYSEGTYDVTDYASVVVNIVETVTLTVRDQFQAVVSFTINGVDYTSSFSNGYAYIVVPKNTDLVWSATAPGNDYYNPSSGTLNLSSDSTLRLKLTSGDIIV